jgi:hypothetical protein
MKGKIPYPSHYCKGKKKQNYCSTEPHHFLTREGQSNLIVLWVVVRSNQETESFIKRHGPPPPPPPVNTIRLIEVLENNTCYKNIRKII